MSDKICEKDSDVKTGYLVFLITYVAYVMVCMTRTCFSAATAQVVKEGLMTKSQTGLITTSFYLVYAALQVPGGMLADKIKPIKLVMLGIIGTFIANTVIYFNNRFYVMLIFWVLNGLSQMGFWPAILKILASDVITKNVKNSSFLFSTSTAIGFSFSYLVASLVKKWQDNFLFSSFMMMVIFFMLLLFLKPIKYVTCENNTEEGKVAENNINILKVLNSGGFMLLVPAIFLWTLVKTGTAALMATMLMESYDNVSSSLGNLITSISVFSGIFGVLFVKILLDKFKKLNQLIVFEISFLILLPFWIFMPKIGVINFWFAAFSLYLTQLLLAAGQLIINIDYVMVFSKFGKEATVSGIVNAVASFAFVAANYGSTRVADVFGWKTLCTIFLIMIIAINLLMFFVLPIWEKFLKRIEN